jgi:hypothetical protein
MGINRTTLISRMKKLGIDPRQYAWTGGAALSSAAESAFQVAS